MKPHKSQYWLTPRRDDEEAFAEEVETVCQTYLDAPRAAAEDNVHTVSVDEKTGIQAIERSAPSLPMQPGRPEKIEFEYQRHGTLCLIGNLNVVTGEIIAPTIGPTRTEADFAQHIRRTVALDPSGTWVFVADNLNTHVSESLVRLVAELCGLEDDLGRKGKSGVLETMATRKAFLQSSGHRIRFVYTPKHASWLNQIECWFSTLARRVLKRGSFTSLGDLQQRLCEFIEYFNQTMAKPLRWTFNGRPLGASSAARSAR